MFDRFLPTELFRAHWKALSAYSDLPTDDRSEPAARPKPDHASRALLLGVPAAVAIVCLIAEARLGAPAMMLAAVALMAGGLLSAFTHISTLRRTYTERADRLYVYEQGDRDFIDETATHMLMGAYVAGIAAVLLVVGINFFADCRGAIAGWFVALPVYAVSYLVMVFLLVVPRLYVCYATINKVRRELNGSSINRR